MNLSHPGQIPREPVPFITKGIVRSKDLLGAGAALVIEHGGERYVLRQTKNGKLILTK